MEAEVRRFLAGPRHLGLGKAAMYNELEASLLAQIRASEMWPHLQELCKHDRLSGSDGERQAMDYLIAQARACGLPVQVYEFDAYLSSPIRGTLQVLDDTRRFVPAKTRSFSANTPEEGVQGELVYCRAPRTCSRMCGRTSGFRS